LVLAGLSAAWVVCYSRSGKGGGATDVESAGSAGAAGAPAPEPGIRIDQRALAVSVPATVARQGAYKELGGAIEYLVVARGGKEYETVFVASPPAREIHDALRKVGLHPGPSAEAGRGPRGQPVRIFVDYRLDGRPVRRPADEFVLRVRPKTPKASGSSAQPLAAAGWPFTGSGHAVNPETGRQILRASLTGSIVALHPTDPSCLFQNPRPEAAQQNIYRANAAELPPPGTAVRVVFQRVRRPVAAGSRRAHVLAAGRLAGVGFSTFAANRARRLGLSGFVRDLPDGGVEAVVEGAAEKVEKFLAGMRRGPRAARVEKLVVRDEPPAGDLEGFEIWYGAVCP